MVIWIWNRCSWFAFFRTAVKCRDSMSAIFHPKFSLEVYIFCTSTVTRCRFKLLVYGASRSDAFHFHFLCVGFYFHCFILFASDLGDTGISKFIYSEAPLRCKRKCAFEYERRLWVWYLHSHLYWAEMQFCHIYVILIHDVRTLQYINA
jgi:hypothetical protein